MEIFYPGEQLPAPEPFPVGMLKDGTRTVPIDFIDSYYHDRKHGYDAGAWMHEYVYVPLEDRYAIASTHLATGTEKVVYPRPGVSLFDWHTEVPKDQSHL